MPNEKNRYKLPKNFFDENPLERISPAQLTHMQIATYSWTDFNEEMTEKIVPNMEEDRRKKYEWEKQQIPQINTVEDVIKFMRKLKDPLNRMILLEKALSMQKEVIPLILKRLLTSAHDVFIENAAMVLALADMKYVEQLYDMFHDIRDPYARSEASIAFGVKQRIDYTPLLLEQYKKIRQECPDKDYEQGPLLALYLMHGE